MNQLDTLDGWSSRSGDSLSELLAEWMDDYLTGTDWPTQRMNEWMDEWLAWLCMLENRSPVAQYVWVSVLAGQSVARSVRRKFKFSYFPLFGIFANNLLFALVLFCLYGFSVKWALCTRSIPARLFISRFGKYLQSSRNFFVVDKFHLLFFDSLPFAESLSNDGADGLG